MQDSLNCHALEGRQTVAVPGRVIENIDDFASRGSSVDLYDYYNALLDHTSEDSQIGKKVANRQYSESAQSARSDRNDDSTMTGKPKTPERSDDSDNLVDLGHEVSQYILRICGELESMQRLNKELTNINEELLEENEGLLSQREEFIRENEDLCRQVEEARDMLHGV